MTNEVVLGDKWNWLWMILGIKAEEPLNTIPSQHPAKQSRTRLVFLNSSAIAAGSSLSLLKASDLPLIMTASEIFDSWAVSQPENLKLNLSTFILRTKLLGLVQGNPIFCCSLRTTPMKILVYLSIRSTVVECLLLVREVVVTGEVLHMLTEQNTKMETIIVSYYYCTPPAIPIFSGFVVWRYYSL